MGESFENDGPAQAASPGRWSEQQIRELYGETFAAEVAGRTGVLHVAAVWRRPDGVLMNLAINDAMPRSRSDKFVLALAEARADAIVTSGRNLRHEPHLVHAIDGPHAGDLAAWRQHVLGRVEPPWTVVLTRRGEVDLAHPIFHSGSRPMVFCTGTGATRDDAGGRGVEWVPRPGGDLRSLIDYLRMERGCQRVLLEVGPSTAAEAYDEPNIVDELLLSICVADRIDKGAEGDPFLSLGRVAEAGLELVSEVERQEESGPWLFRRYGRRR